MRKVVKQEHLDIFLKKDFVVKFILIVKYKWEGNYLKIMSYNPEKLRNYCETKDGFWFLLVNGNKGFLKTLFKTRFFKLIELFLLFFQFLVFEEERKLWAYNYAIGLVENRTTYCLII